MINQNRLITTFMDMVKIDSESGSESDFAQYLLSQGNQLADRSWQDAHGNVYLQLNGKAEPLMFNTHMDTVTPGKNIYPQIKDNYITSDGTTILGADSKAGIAAMIEVIHILKSVPRPTLIFTFTRNEETGIPTAPHIQPLAKNCVVPDRGTPLGEIIIHAPYAQVFQTTVHGKSAYATTNYDDGCHAIMAATQIISQLPVGNFKPDSTSNIGIINGGTMTTNIPELCTFKGNCYSFDQQSVMYFFNQLTQLSNQIDQQYHTQTHTEMLEYFPGFQIPETHPLVHKVTHAMQQSDFHPTIKKYKAVSNANHLNALGMNTVLISTGVENQHTTQERISITSLCKLAEIIHRIAIS